jgi:hypothetical protein
MTSKIPEQFIPRPRSMLESEAYRSLSLSARRVMERIELEHLCHGGKDNGKLPVTRRDFTEYGVTSKCVQPAKAELIRKGFLRITRKGRSGKHGTPTEYRLTYIHANNRPPTNEWKRYDDISSEREPIRGEKGNQLGSETQQNLGGKREPNKGGKREPLSREVSSTTTPAALRTPNGSAAPETTLCCAYCHVADGQVHLAAGRWYPRGGLWLHRACRQPWLNENRAVAHR